MRLLELAPQLQSWLTQGRISVGHAKVLLSIKSHDEQTLIAELVIKGNLTVRAAEKLVARHFASQGVKRNSRGNSPSTHSLSPALLHLQNRLQQHFATHVALQHGDKRGQIEIDYYGADDLQRILALLGIQPDET
jgi:ParB family chromosome partitioning protein